jgi:hypothetical protein
MIMLAIFFVRAVILVQTEHVNDNFQELLRFCLFLVSWLEDFCKDLVEISEKFRRTIEEQE